MRTIDGSEIKWKFDENRANVPGHIRGKHCFLYEKGGVLEEAKKLFGRENENVALKIFFLPLEGEMKDYYWGRAWSIYSTGRTEEIGRISKLEGATFIQNLCWLEGLAPRVYALLLIERNGKKYPAQLVQKLEGEIAPSPAWVRNQAEKVLTDYLKQFDCKVSHLKLLRKNDFIDGKLIDFQGFRLGKKTKEKIRDYVREHGKYGKYHYQSVPEIGLTAKPRDTEQRIKDMKLEEINFEGKTVLDAGCSLGVFCNYSAKRGAKRVVGIDLNIKAPQVLSFSLGHHNNDYIVKDLTIDTIDGNFDIVFYLSMNIHCGGMQRWLAHQTKEIFIFEENAKGSNFKQSYWEKWLRQFFKSVELVGHATDAHKGKPIFWCRK